jgi:hypothetical protein
LNEPLTNALASGGSFAWHDLTGSLKGLKLKGEGGFSFEKAVIPGMVYDLEREKYENI